MKELKPNRKVAFTINLPPRTKKNHGRIITNPKTGKPMYIPSKEYKDYEHDAAWFMPHTETVREPVNIRAQFYMPTHRRVDLVNLEQALLDILVKYDVIEDDNSQIVASMDGSRVMHDKENPRTEVIIEYESRAEDS